MLILVRKALAPESSIVSLGYHAYTPAFRGIAPRLECSSRPSITSNSLSIGTSHTLGMTEKTRLLVALVFVNFPQHFNERLVWLALLSGFEGFLVMRFDLGNTFWPFEFC